AERRWPTESCQIRPTRVLGVGGKLHNRGRVSGVFGTTPLANVFPLCPLRIRESVAGAKSEGVCRVWVPDFSHGRNDLPGYADSFASVVSRHVVGDHSEERG